LTILDRIKKHLTENNMTYCEHWKFAISHGFLCIEAGLLLIIHSFLPCVFEKAGSTLIKKLNISFNQHKKEARSAKIN
jgi:hypothetical protein